MNPLHEIVSTQPEVRAIKEQTNSYMLEHYCDSKLPSLMRFFKALVANNSEVLADCPLQDKVNSLFFAALPLIVMQVKSDEKFPASCSKLIEKFRDLDKDFDIHPSIDEIIYSHIQVNFKTIFETTIASALDLIPTELIIAPPYENPPELTISYKVMDEFIQQDETSSSKEEL